MEITEYWEFLDDVLAEADDELDGDAVLDTYATFLADLPPDELADISRLVKGLDARATTWPMLGACAVLLGTSGDAEFEDFRGWLISRGRDTFEKVVADPDALAEFVEPGSEDTYQIEGWVSASDEAYVAITDEEPEEPDVEYPVVLSDRDPNALDTDDEEMLAARYPALAASLHEPEPLVDDEAEDDVLEDPAITGGPLDAAAHLDAAHDDADPDEFEDDAD